MYLLIIQLLLSLQGGIDDEFEFSESENIGHHSHGGFGRSEDKIIIIEQKLPEPGVCFTWGGVHYKTFDGKIFSFESECPHTLIQAAQNGLFTITTLNSPGCRTGGACFRIVKIFIHEKEYTLSQNDEGVPEFRSKTKVEPFSFILYLLVFALFADLFYLIPLNIFAVTYERILNYRSLFHFFKSILHVFDTGLTYASSAARLAS